MQHILCTNASSVSMHSLKTLSIEMDLAESVFNRKIFINGSRTRRFLAKSARHSSCESPESKSLRASLFKEDPSNNTTVNQRDRQYLLTERMSCTKYPPICMPWVWFLYSYYLQSALNCLQLCVLTLLLNFYIFFNLGVKQNIYRDILYKHHALHVTII